MAEIDLFTFPPLDTEHTARWAEVSNPHPAQRNATAPGASTRLTEMVTSLQDLPSNNSSKRHPCHPFNACRCPKNDTQVVCKNAVILRFGWQIFILKCWGFMNHMNRVPQSWRPSCNFCKPKGDKGAFQERHANSTWRPGGQEGGLFYADTTILCHLWTVLKQTYAQMSCMSSFFMYILASCHSLSQSLPNLLVWIQ